MELKVDRTTRVPKSVLRLSSGLGSGASIWNWASIALVPQMKRKIAKK